MINHCDVFRPYVQYLNVKFFLMLMMQMRKALMQHHKAENILKKKKVLYVMCVFASITR